MALSGVTTLQLNRDQIIAAAMRKFGGLAKGQAPDSIDLINGTEALNAIVAEMQGLGMPLWSLATENAVLVAGVTGYTISGPSTGGIVQAWTELYTGGSRQEMIAVADHDMNRFPLNSTGTGVPTQYSYIPQINTGALRIWPAPSGQTAIERYIAVRFYKKFDQFVNATDNPFFPQEWNNALIYRLAVALAPENGVPLQDRGMLQKEAEMHTQLALDSSQEWASIFFQPDRRDWY